MNLSHKLNPLQRGTSYPAVRDSDVLSQELRLPPLPEQHRIVAEIEKQFTRLDASESALKRAQANLRRYRASVLKAACEGKLVPTEAALAQAEGRDYEPADQLLERILAERRARWEAQGKKKSKYKEAASPDTAAPGWSCRKGGCGAHWVSASRCMLGPHLGGPDQTTGGKIYLG